MAPLLRKQSDDKAFERLYERHVKDVFRYSMAVLGERADAEDVTQTTFLNAYRAFQRGERPEKPENWLIAIAHNVCRQRFRQQQRRPSEVEFEEELGGAVERDDSGPSVEELRRAFAALPPNQRAALVMRELEGRRYDEIAGVLGITVSALETLLFRARRSLREQLEEQLSCREAAFALSKQLDGRLTAGERKALRAHLRGCPECSRLASGQRAQRKALRTLLAVPLPQSLQTFWPHAAETAGGGVAAGGTALAVKAAAVVAAGSLVGGGAYEGVTHVPPLLDGPKPAAARRAPAAPAAVPVAHAAVRVRTVHATAVPVAPAVHAAPPAHKAHGKPHRAKPHHAIPTPAAPRPAVVLPVAAPPASHRRAQVVHTALPGRATGKPEHRSGRAHRQATVRTHPQPHAVGAKQKPAGRRRPAQHGNGNAGGNGNGNPSHAHASPPAPQSDPPAPSVTVTIPELPSVPPPPDLPANNGNGNGGGRPLPIPPGKS